MPKFRVKYNEIKTTTMIVEFEAKDEQHAKDMILRVPSDLRPSAFYKVVRAGSPSVVDEVEEVKEVTS